MNKIYPPRDILTVSGISANLYSALLYAIRVKENLHFLRLSINSLVESGYNTSRNRIGSESMSNAKRLRKRATDFIIVSYLLLVNKVVIVCFNRSACSVH